jgi:aminoglycoside 3-N-acetyltransferase
MKNYNIFKRDLLKKIKFLKLKKNDVVYLAVNIGNLFSNYITAEFLKKQQVKTIAEKISTILHNEIKKSIGPNGTIIVPVFSFKSIINKKFYPKKTRSELGFFSNFFLKKKKTIRSLHPTFSLAAEGKYAKFICKNNGKFPFGRNSAFGKIENLNCKFVNFGVKFYQSCTYVHHLEHLNGFHIRYNKVIKCKIYSNNKHFNDYYFTNVRFLKIPKVEPTNFYKLMKIKGKIKMSNKNFFCSIIDIKDVNKIGLENLKKNPFFFENKKTLVRYNENIKVIN